ncbi:MAG: zinc metalloprotease HtpX [Candidatus Doudnabacteria bacterium RIFCSPHIGHO2_02_FULL_46_11]|uniref:Protease HtpX homolog n=1 Tax=Candidatus Doudnabacteria bacterium RIFCSPHIGHO2_02_FULL_46_11 TaxID=1817832 RepID=A0A1F5P4L4_9BACT|nr:MAG: zinc metalloprotease HtpX [Candidatus Doudnabacteria bacterium RIFCSPHIGHO2_02_FULL_46_11]
MVYTQISSNKRKTALLITFFLVLIIGLGYTFSYSLESPGILFFAVILSIGMSFISYFYSDKIVLKMSKAKEIDRQANQELYRLVENLSITAGLPTPKIYVIDDTALNAFATGRDPQHAVIAFTTGILQKLDKNELEGVAAHELSHIGNYDIRLSTIIVVLVGIVALLSDWFLRISFLGGGRRNREGGQIGAIIAVAGIVLALLSPLIATLIQLAVSRQREYLADASGVMLTRYPQGLSNALRKLAGDHEPLEVANKATAHLYIVNPLKDLHGGRSLFKNLFSTHPPLEDRVKRLEQINL